MWRGIVCVPYTPEHGTRHTTVDSRHCGGAA